MKNTVIALMFAAFRNCLLRTLDPYRIRSVLAVTAMKMVKMNARRIATMSTHGPVASMGGDTAADFDTGRSGGPTIAPQPSELHVVDG